MFRLPKSDLVLLVTLVVLIVLTRTIFHIGENIEFVTAASIASGYFLQKKNYSFLVPLFGLAISDILIGNTLIFTFTWSGFIAAPLLGILLYKKIASMIIGSEAMGIISTMIFFLWTNFGVVVTTNMYAKTVEGLVQSYISALPFLRNQLLANIIFVPLVLITISIILNYKRSNLVNKTLFQGQD